jgi:hypothetical protein
MEQSAKQKTISSAQQLSGQATSVARLAEGAEGAYVGVAAIWKQAMALITGIEILGAIVLAAAVIYVATRWSRRRDKRYSSATAPSPSDAASMRKRASPPDAGALDPMTLGKLRSAREGDRPSEDDIARETMGPRGKPGEPPVVPDLTESETQMPKPLDPGHTA